MFEAFRKTWSIERQVFPPVVTYGMPQYKSQVSHPGRLNGNDHTCLVYTFVRSGSCNCQTDVDPSRDFFVVVNKTRPRFRDQ
jgi:hypothetical protein